VIAEAVHKKLVSGQHIEGQHPVPRPHAAARADATEGLSVDHVHLEFAGVHPAPQLRMKSLRTVALAREKKASDTNQSKSKSNGTRTVTGSSPTRSVYSRTFVGMINHD